MTDAVSREGAAGILREQAASYRRLAGCARTPTGASSLAAIADQFDDDARRMDPLSIRLEAR